MTTLAIFLTSLAFATALALSIGACVVAIRSWHLCRSTSAAALSVRLTDLEQTCEVLSQGLNRVRARQNMQLLRARQREATGETDPSPPVDAEKAAAERRAELNSQLARQMPGAR